MSLFTLTDNAKEQISFMYQEHETYAVRLSVKGGGCAGFQYDWGFAKEDQIEKTDEVTAVDNGNFLVDSMSVMYVAGTEIDYVKEAFGLNRPFKSKCNTPSCGCGESLSSIKNLSMDYSGLSHKELLTKLQDLTKRIVYIERTQMGALTLARLRADKIPLMLEALRDRKS